jgi:hypothetical protein
MVSTCFKGRRQLAATAGDMRRAGGVDERIRVDGLGEADGLLDARRTEAADFGLDPGNEATLECVHLVTFRHLVDLFDDVHVQCASKVMARRPRDPSGGVGADGPPHPANKRLEMDAAVVEDQSGPRCTGAIRRAPGASVVSERPRPIIPPAILSTIFH